MQLSGCLSEVNSELYVDMNVRRVYMVFDTYIKQSVKAPIRMKRSAKKIIMLKVIEQGDGSLPEM